MKRIYKGTDVTQDLDLPVLDAANIQHLTIVLHTKSDNDIIKTYPTDIDYEEGTFKFRITSDDITALREGILWYIIDLAEMRDGEVYNYKTRIQSAYYIKFADSITESNIISAEDVRRVVDERVAESIDETFGEVVDEKVSDAIDNIPYKTINGQSIKGSGNITVATTPYDDTAIKNRVAALERIDHSQYVKNSDLDAKGYLTEHQPMKTINGQSIVGEGNLILGEGGTVIEEYDDTELRERVGALEQKEDHDTIYDDTAIKNRVAALERIDHSKYLTSHQPLKTINGESIIGEGNIVISAGGGEVIVEEYDDTELRGLISNIDTRVAALEQNPVVQPYDDTELRQQNALRLAEITLLQGSVAALEGIDHSKYLTQHQSLEGYAKISDVDSVNALITALTARVAELEKIDHSKYLTAHQPIKTINNISLVGEGNIDMETDYDIIYTKLDQI